MKILTKLYLGLSMALIGLNESVARLIESMDALNENFHIIYLSWNEISAYVDGHSEVQSLGQGWATFLRVCAKIDRVFDAKFSLVPIKILHVPIMYIYLFILYELLLCKLTCINLH